MSETFTRLDSYIHMAKQANTHIAKQQVLSRLLEEMFGVRLEDLLLGIEKRIDSKILGVRGSVDLLYSNVIFEVKVDLEREMDDARGKLKKYFQAMLEARPQEKFIGIATDVINYKAFVPVVRESEVVDVREISSINISEVPAGDAILWLDSYIFSRPTIIPTARDLKFRFGPGSPTYAIAVDTLKSLWELVKDKEDVKLKYELWLKSMEIVYGSRPEIEAFIDQTYLITLVKIIAYLRLSGDNIITRDKVLEALTGEYFARYGIVNLVEEDFFTWIIHERIVNESLELVNSISKELLRYDLTKVNEDFFKEIYQEIVERGQRHRVGEYYTPEWLTELVLVEVLSLWREMSQEPPRILDPACGSGTFLCNSIHMLKEELKKRGWEDHDILNYILTNIVGVDTNPLAITIARVNYLIALGELLHAREGLISLPVYVADSIRLPKLTKTLIGDLDVYEYIVNNTHLQIPAEVARSPNRLGRVVAAFREAIESYRIRRDSVEAHKVFERMLQNIITETEFDVLRFTLNNILALIDHGRDSIWIYMLSNIYVPIALSESKFHILVGNPPWIAMRYIENKEYQDFIKGQFLYYELVDKVQVKLFTHIEVATLFFNRASDLYLRDKGIIGFVMPRSVLTGALHHVKFREFKKPNMALLKILDLEDVLPLFNVPSCVLIAIKGRETYYPVLARKFSGKLPEKNLKLDSASRYLTVRDYEYQPPQISAGNSPYYSDVKEGATIVPRCLWFIEFVVHPTLGINTVTPYCKTSKEALRDSKEPWRNITIEGNIERDFIYATVLSTNLISFGYILTPVVLPIEPTARGYTLLDVQALRNRGFTLMADWLERAQRVWEERRTEKAEERFSTILDRLNYGNLLSVQNPHKRYIVLYNSSGTNVVSCVIDKQRLQPFSINGFTITPRGFIADAKTWFYETNDGLEAHYLCAVLNSDIVNEAIKPLQTKGLYGERDIHRRPFMLPIPRFDPNNSTHNRLAELSKICHDRISNIVFTRKSAAGRRSEAREAVRREIEEINRLVSQLLNVG